jgi:hypothetical protein
LQCPTGAGCAAPPRPIKGRRLHELKQLVRARRQERSAPVALMTEFSALDEDLYQTSQLYGMDLDRHTGRNCRRGSGN